MLMILQSLFLAAMVFGMSSAQAATIEGRVTRVSGGDTITVVNRDRQSIHIRIHGIDAPEKTQGFGESAAVNLARLVAGKEITAECYKVDKHKRQVCKVWAPPQYCATCGKTLDVGHAQVVAGWAWWHRPYANEQSAEDRGRYESAEQEAKARKIGLWSDTTPIAPWDFRKKR